MRVAFIGAGAMGGAMVKCLLDKKVVAPQDITVCDVRQARLEDLKQKHNIRTCANKREAIEGAEVAVIAVKPQDLGEVISDLKTRVPQQVTVLSIVAGVTLDSLRQGLEHPYVVRAMPNMPAQIGEGITVWTATDEVTEQQKKLVSSLLGTVGKEIYVTKEGYLDMATALSGSGPAYIFLVIEALIDAGVYIGLPRDIAEKLTIETILGSVHAVQAMGKHPAELRNMVTSPGGTTVEGLRQLEAGGLRHLFLQAVIAAHEKAKSLGVKK